jgi:hypothetical protein
VPTNARHYSDQPLLDPLVAEHARLVKGARRWCLYPTVGARPAILKGWLDRVLVPGVGFGFDEDGKVVPGLGHVRHLIGISTYGSPRLYVRLMNDNGWRTVMRTLRLNTGLRTRARWYGFYAIDTATEARRTPFDRVVKAAGCPVKAFGVRHPWRASRRTCATALRPACREPVRLTDLTPRASARTVGLGRNTTSILHKSPTCPTSPATPTICAGATHSCSSTPPGGVASRAC